MSGPLIIYDCDGTLIDTETICVEVCLAAIHELGMTDWTVDRYVETFVGIPASVGWKHVEDIYGKPFPPGFTARVDGEIHARFRSDMRVLPGVRSAVESIGGPRCVASSTALPSLTRNLQTAGLIDLFGEAVFSASQVKRGKPSPDVFLFAASQMGHDPGQCLVVEDSAPGVEAARRAGMVPVGFTGASHDRARTARRLTEAGARVVVEHMDDLPAALAALAPSGRTG
jgi:HAD superfamily hydrolase (TIGR01509 family)